MSELALVREMEGDIEDICLRVGEAIKPYGFGILTRIDFDKKILEKLGEKISPCVILGACNPRLALEAYRQSADVALLIPCNISVTQTGDRKVRIEAMRPSQMLKMLPLQGFADVVKQADQDLMLALKSL